MGAIGVGVAAAGIVGLGVLGVISAPLLVAAAGGVLVAFGVSVVAGAMNGSFTSSTSNFDDWGARTLLSEGIGALAGMAGYGVGNAAQWYAENTNITTMGGVAKTVLSAAESLSANQAGQAIANTVTGMVSAAINYSRIHAPGNGSGSTPNANHPGSRPTPTPAPTPTHSSNGGSGNGSPIYTPPTRNPSRPTSPGSSRPTPAPPSSSKPTSPSVRYYTVTSGDTLSGIANSFYGSGLQWQRIYQVNAGVIGGNPNLIYPGERLAIPR